VTRPFIPFNRPYATGRECDYIREAIASAHLSGDGLFTRRCHAWLEERVGVRRALLTHSCTAALEMAALLTIVQPGDEVVMPSYTFVSTANAFVLRGAVPVFVDIRPDTLNLDEQRVADAVTSRTKGIVAVHYAGVPCEMDEIAAVARLHDLVVIEDAAQALGSTYRSRPAGTLGAMAATSFHETKNVISGEGGALLINDPALVPRAEIIREKGTDRSRFLRGDVDKYSWVDVGSSFLPSEITAAFLWAQLEVADRIAAARLETWRTYYEALADLERRERIRRPVVPEHCRHNAHMFYVLVNDRVDRAIVLRHLNANGINAVFHYVPLHSSPAGRQYGRPTGKLPHTETLSERLIRLPLWVGLQPSDIARIVETLTEALP
jgi:dTDP-4-amino-4,6-dideoxygalactose transaminase